jgi:hypothetical protein
VIEGVPSVTLTSLAELYIDGELGLHGGVSDDHVRDLVRGKLNAAQTEWARAVVRPAAGVMPTTDTEYRTFDIHRAAFSVVRGRKLLGLSGDRFSRREFIFTADAAADDDDYYGRGLVGARDYAAALRLLKARLFQN